MVRVGRWIAAAWIMATAWTGMTAVAAPPQPNQSIRALQAPVNDRDARDRRVVLRSRRAQM